MKVIWHQAIGVEIERKFSFLLFEQTGELEIVIVGPEYLSTIIPASDSSNSSNLNKVKPDNHPEGTVASFGSVR